jgi:serine/threonine protein phosphatase PrpC
MKYTESGVNKIFYLEPADDFPLVASVVTHAAGPVVLILPPDRGAFRTPGDFHALKQVKRTFDPPIRLVMAGSPALQILARRCGFPVFPSLESIGSEAVHTATHRPGLSASRWEGGPPGRDGETSAYEFKALCFAGCRDEGATANPSGIGTLHLIAGSASNPGVRHALTPNEDYVFSYLSRQHSAGGVLLHFGLFVVADGMGVRTNGCEAARLAIEALTGWILPSLTEGQVEDVGTLLAEGVRQANLAIYRKNEEQQTDVGALLTAVLVVDEVVWVANVGGCRTYLYRPDFGLSQVTTDHAQAVALLPTGIIGSPPLWKRNHEVVRRLGGTTSIGVDSCTLRCLAGDILLLCSDGLWNVVEPAVIERILKAYALRPSLACRTLVEAGLEAGGPDNISAIVVSMQHQVGDLYSARASGIPPVLASLARP